MNWSRGVSGRLVGILLFYGLSYSIFWLDGLAISYAGSFVSLSLWCLNLSASDWFEVPLSIWIFSILCFFFSKIFALSLVTQWDTGEYVTLWLTRYSWRFGPEIWSCLRYWRGAATGYSLDPSRDESLVLFFEGLRMPAGDFLFKSSSYSPWMRLFACFGWRE